MIGRGCWRRSHAAVRPDHVVAETSERRPQLQQGRALIAYAFLQFIGVSHERPDDIRVAMLCSIDGVGSFSNADRFAETGVDAGLKVVEIRVDALQPMSEIHFKASNPSILQSRQSATPHSLNRSEFRSG